MRIDFTEATQWLNQSDHLVIVSHVNPDGDAIGSTLAAGYICRMLGKSFTLMNASPVPDRYDFLPDWDVIQSKAEGTSSFRYILTLDAADRDRIGSCSDLFDEEATILNIDHHPTNDHFGDVNLVVPDAAATTEILYDWVKALGIPLTRQLASYIYTGLSDDTGGFRYANTSSKVHQQVSELMETGLHVQHISEKLFMTTSLSRLQMLQRALSTLTVSSNGLYAWMWIRPDENIPNDVFDGIVNYAKNIEGVDVGIFFRQKGDEVRVNFRSKQWINVAELAQTFGGGGHARAAGCTISGELSEVIPQVTVQIEQQWREFDARHHPSV